MRKSFRILGIAAVAAVIANEVRGIVLAAPVLWGMYQAGGTAAAIWIGLCALSGIALSVIVPAYLLRKFARAH
jgi:fumarate reductase subunit D